jgi:hypothetical protein
VTRAKHPIRRQKKKSSGKRKPELAFLNGAIVSRVRREIDDRWPNLGRQFVSLIVVSRKKLAEIYCSAAETINEHKEAFEDRRAGRKAEARAAAQKARRIERKALPPRP